MIAGYSERKSFKILSLHTVHIVYMVLNYIQYDCSKSVTVFYKIFLFGGLGCPHSPLIIYLL